MNFEVKKLKDISVNGRGNYGIGASSVPFSKNKYTYLRITDIKNDGTIDVNNLTSVEDINADKYILKKNDIVFARTGASTGRNYFYDGKIENLVYAGFLIKFSLDDRKVFPQYVKYYCLSDQYQVWLQGSLTGSTRGNINEKQLSELPIVLPDLETQKKVVRILSALDNKIELNSQQNQTLNRALDELYNEYEASALRKELLIPAKQLFTFEQGVEPGSKAYYPERLLGMVNFYRVGDMCEKCKNFINSDLAKGKILQKNDVVVSFDATIGRIAYGLEGAYSTGMKKISISNEYKKIVSNSFIYAYFRNKNTQDVMSQCAKGTTILHASSAIDSLAVPYDKNLLPELSKKISAIFDKLLSLKEESETLSKIRDALLPKLMNGEINLEGIRL